MDGFYFKGLSFKICLSLTTSSKSRNHVYVFGYFHSVIKWFKVSFFFFFSFHSFKQSSSYLTIGLFCKITGKEFFFWITALNIIGSTRLVEVIVSEVVTRGTKYILLVDDWLMFYLYMKLMKTLDDTNL